MIRWRGYDAIYLDDTAYWFPLEERVNAVALPI
jgi:hypothetical protein